jgi:hypothetical protein
MRGGEALHPVTMSTTITVSGGKGGDTATSCDTLVEVLKGEGPRVLAGSGLRLSPPDRITWSRCPPAQHG